MSKIITDSELQQLSYEELRALWGKVSRELNQTAPNSGARRTALANLDNIQRAMVRRLSTPLPRPRF